jgi:hypothetical protein
MNLRPYRPQAVNTWTVDVLSLVDLDQWTPTILGVDTAAAPVRVRRGRPIAMSPSRTLAKEEG